MATREQVIDKLREKGYVFKRDAWRVGLFKKPGTTQRVEVPKRDILSDEWVRSAFRQAGMTTAAPVTGKAVEMRYVGGKTRIAAWVEQHVSSLANGHTTYLEPFVGSGATFVRLAPRFQSAIASDEHADLILMWQALASGWDPPEHVSKDEYVALRTAKPSALRGFVGFGASFSGKWFGGYVDTAWDEHWQRFTKPYLGAARTSVLKMRSVFERASVFRADYREHCPGHHTLVYCDPPYEGTLGYGGTSKFDSGEFWEVARRWSSLGATVIVSESRAPVGWRALAERTRKAMLRVAVDEENEVRRETLWIPE